ncbi:MAG TPA: methylated-DNA--[protein]-cysteine S-methyltransferase [Gemmatimonadaceae bacterium]|nr:methylated-DNA--[protein]-cysteine S-methyltransferase [Gemmatimonadaceae bacterium]
MLCSGRLTTPIGAMFAVADDRGLVLCEFHDRPFLPTQLKRVERICGGKPVAAEHPYLDQTQRELDEYFLGQRETFTIPLLLDGTPFQGSVWQQLLNIPFGKTLSYDDVATRIGRPGGARAVGRANGDNRIAIIVPCHRVINSDGSLAGYGGGKRRKRWLLAHERRGVQLSLIPEFDQESVNPGIDDNF